MISNFSTSSATHKQNQSFALDQLTALRHLELLGYTGCDAVYVRLLDKTNHLPPIGKSWPVDAIPWDWIAQQQSQGYSVYVAVNGGPKDADVTQCRAFFVEWDDIPIPQQYERLETLVAQGFPAPTFTVQTRKSVHAYWVLAEPLPVDIWRETQAQLVALTQSDPAIKNPSRVMRLAGSWHVQGGLEPVMCTLQVWDKPVSLVAITHALAQLAKPVASVPLVQFLSRNHQRLVAQGTQKGSRNGNAYALACDLLGCAVWLRRQGFEPEPDPYALFLEFCRKCEPGDGWDAREWEKVWRSATSETHTPCCSESILQARLRRLVGTPDPDEDAEQAKPVRKSVARLLVELALDEADLWLGDDKQAWADVVVDQVRYSWPVRSNYFKHWLARRLWEDYQSTVNSEALQSALAIIESKCLFGQVPQRQVWLRVAQQDGRIYIDVADVQNHVIEVRPDGWTVLDSHASPVRFCRLDFQQALPLPQPGGDIHQLWDFIPVQPTYRPLVLAWLAFSLVPTGAKPILVLHGPKGAGKSTTARVLKRLIDPHRADLLDKVGDSTTLAVNAKHRWVMAYDNLTALTTGQQDALCRVATGAGYAVRRLYTDSDETVVEYLRPQILTALECIPTRSDLLDRCLLVGLDRIDESQRRTDSELWTRFDEAAPYLLGALLDLVTTALANLPHQEQSTLPRMADFAKFGMAILGDDFRLTYQGNITLAQTHAIESHPVASAIVELLQGQDKFEGTATQLLTALQQVSDAPEVAKLTSRSLGRLLGSRAFVQDLETAGVYVDSYRTPDRKRERGWLLSTTPPDIMRTSTGHEGGKTSEKRPTPKTPPDGHFGHSPDVSDVSDMKKPTLSGVTTPSLPRCRPDLHQQVNQNPHQNSNSGFNSSEFSPPSPPGGADMWTSLQGVLGLANKKDNCNLCNVDMTPEKQVTKTSETSAKPGNPHAVGISPSDIIPGENVRQTSAKCPQNVRQTSGGEWMPYDPRRLNYGVLVRYVGSDERLRQRYGQPVAVKNYTIPGRYLLLGDDVEWLKVDNFADWRILPQQAEIRQVAQRLDEFFNKRSQGGN